MTVMINNPRRGVGRFVAPPQMLANPTVAMEAVETITPAATAVPTQQYGLSGAENILREAGTSGLNILDSGRREVRDAARTGVGMLMEGRNDVRDLITTIDNDTGEILEDYTSAGGAASDLQAALSGALGPAAQARAMQNFQNSPFLDQVRQNAERAILQNASATGGIGSGNTLDQLYQNAAGLFLNDFNNRFAQLGSLADRGYGAASTEAGIGANLGSLEANLMTDLISRASAIPLQAAGTNAGIASQMANIPLNLGSQAAGYRYQTGRDIADAVQGTTSALSDLVNRQGEGITGMVGDLTTNVNNLIQAATQGDAVAKEQLATLLANLSVQQGSSSAAVPAAQVTQTNRLGQTGQLASGIGALLEALA